MVGCKFAFSTYIIKDMIVNYYNVFPLWGDPHYWKKVKHSDSYTLLYNHTRLHLLLHNGTVVTNFEFRVMFSQRVYQATPVKRFFMSPWTKTNIDETWSYLLIHIHRTEVPAFFN